MFVIYLASRRFYLGKRKNVTEQPRAARLFATREEALHVRATLNDAWQKARVMNAPTESGST